MHATQIVCIVDDDESVRLAMSSLVRSLGWQTNLFSTADAYLQSPQVGETAFLISDVRMPGMSGIEMHDRLHKLGHAPPTIFITAYPTTALAARLKVNGVLAILTKPVDAAALTHWLTHILGKP